MIDKKTLLKGILNRKDLVDYTYGILFLIISSFFLFFAIRPALTIAFSLQRESIDLKKLNAQYEENVLKIVELQSNIELARNDLYILDEALPQKPNMDKFVREIKTAALISNLTVTRLEVQEVPLKEKTKSTAKKKVSVRIDGNGEYAVIKQFINEILSQRRIKTIKNITIGKNQKQSTDSAALSVIIELEGHYL